MFQCHLWLHIGPLQLHFQLRKRKIVGQTEIWRVRGTVKFFARTTRRSCCSAINTCDTNRARSFHFFQIIRQCGERWFSISRTLQYYPITSTLVVLQNSCHPSDVFVVPSLQFQSAASIDFSPAANQLRHRNTIARGADESLNAFTNVSHISTAYIPLHNKILSWHVVQNFFLW